MKTLFTCSICGSTISSSDPLKGFKHCPRCDKHNCNEKCKECTLKICINPILLVSFEF